MIEITDSPDKTQWSDFVYNHPQGNLFQTPEMAEVYKRTKNLKIKTEEILKKASRGEKEKWLLQSRGKR